MSPVRLHTNHSRQIQISFWNGFSLVWFSPFVKWLMFPLPTLWIVYELFSMLLLPCDSATDQSCHNLTLLLLGWDTVCRINESMLHWFTIWKIIFTTKKVRPLIISIWKFKFCRKWWLMTRIHQGKLLTHLWVSILNLMDPGWSLFKISLVVLSFSSHVTNLWPCFALTGRLGKEAKNCISHRDWTTPVTSRSLPVPNQCWGILLWHSECVWKFALTINRLLHSPGLLRKFLCPTLNPCRL